MEKNEYDAKVEHIRNLLSRQDTKSFQQALDEIEKIKKYRPWSIDYICVQVQAMLRQGQDKEYCRKILDNICQEMYICPELPRLFEVKKETCTEGDLEWRLCDFSAKLYAGKGQERAYIQKLESQKAMFLGSNDIGKRQQLQVLAEDYYVLRNMLMYFVLMMAWCKEYDKLAQYEEYIHEEAGQAYYGFHSLNLGYLARLLQDDAPHIFALAESLQQDNEDIEILSWALQSLGKKVIVLGQPVLGQAGVADKLQQSLAQAVTKGEAIHIRPVVKKLQDVKEYADASSELIQFLADSLEQNTALTVFSQDVMMDELHKVKRDAKHLQRLSMRRPEQFGYAMAFAWAGDYCKYMSYIYGFDVRDRVERPAECDVSVVIPVRNSADTLRYTLQTCLNQNYQGSYEIVLSDNSDAGNTAVYDLYRELNDPRIRYYKTPFYMNLTKSFEFAFLQARGEFIFSIGADDGIFPWTLQHIMSALPLMTEGDLLQWDRGFYAWPQFSPEQQNQMIFSLIDKDNVPPLQKRPLKLDFQHMLQIIPAGLYGFPFGYINSGFRRSYMVKMLKETGVMWDGCSQDLWFGAAALAINNLTYILQEPLAVAGMSSHSIGAADGTKQKEFGNLIQYTCSRPHNIHAQVGDSSWRQEEYLLPFTGGVGGDVLAMYKSILRLVDMAVLSDTEKKMLDREKVIFDILQKQAITDLLVVRNVNNVKACLALPENKDLLKNISIDTRLLELDDTPKAETILYETGYDSSQQTVTLDGSRFGITNIAEAVEFISNMLNLK